MNKQNKTTIKTYINELEKQINEKKNTAYNNYVFLNLDKTYNKNITEKQDSLNDLLKKDGPLNFIISNRKIIDSNKDTWWLCISGYKHGAREESIKKLGLFAYREGYKNKNFKTKIIYDSGSNEFNGYLRKEIIDIIKAKIEIFFNTNLNVGNIYIKPDRKSKK